MYVGTGRPTLVKPLLLLALAVPFVILGLWAVNWSEVYRYISIGVGAVFGLGGLLGVADWLVFRWVVHYKNRRNKEIDSEPAKIARDWAALARRDQQLAHKLIDQMYEDPPADEVRVDLRETETRGKFVHLPGDKTKLHEFAIAVNQGITISQENFCGSGRPYSKKEFRELRSTLIRRGLVAWRNPDTPTLGVQLTPQGRATFRYLAGNEYLLPA